MGRPVLALVLPVVDPFPYTNPDIYQPQTADKAAHKIVQRELPQRQVMEQEVVFGPNPRPRQDHQHDASLYANQHVDRDEDAVQPGFCAGGPWAVSILHQLSVRRFGSYI